MEAYKQMMIIEYRELKERADKLATMLDKWDKGTLDFTPTCSRYLLENQLETMKNYVGILQTRAKLEGVDLNASVDDAPVEKAGWIPVTERLPEEHKGASDTVLVTVARQLDGDKAVITSHTKVGQWNCGALCAVHGAKIIAWMPFPEPYEGDKK